MRTYDEMTLEERRARYRERQALYGTDPCAECGLYGSNVTHDPPEYRADEPYHKEFPDVPYHPFVPDAAVSLSRAGLGALIGTWELEARIGKTVQGRAAYQTCATMLRAILKGGPS